MVGSKGIFCGYLPGLFRFLSRKRTSRWAEQKKSRRNPEHLSAILPDVHAISPEKKAFAALFCIGFPLFSAWVRIFADSYRLRRPAFRERSACAYLLFSILRIDRTINFYLDFIFLLYPIGIFTGKTFFFRSRSTCLLSSSLATARACQLTDSRPPRFQTHRSCFLTSSALLCSPWSSAELTFCLTSNKNLFFGEFHL